MNCEKIQNRFLEMDNRSRIPLSVQAHMLYCSKCRRDITELTNRFASLRTQAPFAMDRDVCEKIMVDVFISRAKYEHHVSGFQWGAVGAIILISLFLIPFSDSFGWLRIRFGTGLEIPISIALGLTFSIYALAGIFSNLEGLKKFVDSLPKKMH
jgi:hypothetical protein